MKQYLGELYGQSIFVDIKTKDKDKKEALKLSIGKWFLEADLALREKEYEKDIKKFSI